MRTSYCLLGLVLFAALSVGAQDDAPFIRETNVVYANTHGVGLVMDVFRPKANPNGRGLIDVLSGAWHSGSAQVRDHIRARLFHIFCSRGYTVFMIRPGSRTKFTAEEMIQNLKTGIRYVKVNSKKYNIDPGRLGITGASAGGHLTLLALTTALNADPEDDKSVDRYGRDIKAAAVFFPPTDFLDWDGKPVDFRLLDNLLFKGGNEGRSEGEIKKQARNISPYHQVKDPLPPTLIIHGDADPAVPLQQSQKMLEALKKSGGTAKLIIKEGGGHPWPTIPEEVEIFADWFDEYLLK